MAAAMDEKMSENVANQLDTLHSNLKLVTEQLKEGESRRQAQEDFSLPTFWERLSATFKIMSHEATKMCLMFSKPPVPSEEESKSLIEGVEKSVLAMISTFYSLPKDQGMTLRKSVRLSVMSVVDELQDLVNHIIKNVGKGSSSQLFATGSVWECCEDFSQLPKDNKEAVLLIIRNTTSLVQDALQEIEEAKDNDAGITALDQLQLEDSEDPDNSEQSWTESDKALMAPCLGLVKAAKACLKKVSGAVKTGGKCDAVERIAQLDDIADVVNQTSPHVDDTVLSLYPPMDHSAVRTNVLALSGVLKNLLDMAKSSHFTTEADSSWLQFLQNAVDHNVDKVRDLTQDPCEDFSQLPKDNKEAVLLIIRNTTSLVQDALQEIEEAKDNDAGITALDQLQLEDSEDPDNSEQSWTESDKAVMAPCLGLVKAAKACLKKVSGAVKTGGKCDTVERIAQLDDIADVVNQTSPHVDDTVLSLYPPMDHSAVRTNALALSGVLKNLLDMAKSSHFTTEADSSWLQFLQNAVDHNVDKVRDLTQDHNSS